MRILSFKVENYRSLKQVSIEKLGGVNLFVGKNSSGKSNILEAINLFFADFEPIKGTTAGMNEYFWYKGLTDKPITFELTLELDDDEAKKVTLDNSAILSVLGEKPQPLQISRSLINVQGEWKTNSIKWGPIPLVTNDAFQTGTGSVPPLREGANHVEVDPLSLEQILTRLSTLLKGKFKLVTTSRDAKTADRFRATIMNETAQNRLWSLQQSTLVSDEEAYTEFENTFSDLTTLRLDPVQGKLMVKKGGRRVPLGLEGEGIQGTINVLFTLLIEMEGSIIVGLEEPESHCHPELQRRLCEKIERMAQKKQIFLVTHSPILVNALQDAATWLVKFAGGQTETVRTNDLERVLHEVAAKPSDILLSNKVLLVEGKSDQIILESAAQELGIDLTGVTVLPTRANGNAAQVLEAVVPVVGKVLPVYLILDSEATEVGIQLIQKGVVGKEQIHVWKAGSIENYYPIDALRKALTTLSTRHSLNLNVDKIIQDVKSGKLQPNKIELGERSRQHLDSSWEVALAEEVAKEIERNRPELSTEVRDTLIAATALPP